jgi:hypothetical protein
MTTFWLCVTAGCALSALFGFTAVRLGARKLGAGAWIVEEPAQAAPQLPRPAVLALTAIDLGAAPVLIEVAPAPVEARPAPERPKAPVERSPTKAPEAVQAPAPTPTNDRPDAKKLALWARQVKSGERKMSIATDGCRVTWNRTCRHGHPSWLVHLGYLKRYQLPRHTPR